MYLKPNVRTIGIAGGTGNGKSEFASIFADAKAKSIMKKSVGNTNSTLKERIVVYTESMNNEMMIAVKLKESIFEREDFNNLITLAISKVIKNHGKIIASEVGKMEVDFMEYLELEIKTKVNSKAVLSFLEEKEIKKIIHRLKDVFSPEDTSGLSFFSKYSYKIYNKVKNDLKTQEVKDNSAKFLGALKNEVQKAIDDMDKSGLWLVLSDINESLSNVFFKYFSEENKSEDGYYYRKINLDKKDENSEFINAIFSSNNLGEGEKLSIEVLCEEIVIYAPINKKIAEMINFDDKLKTVFTDKNKNISIGLYDTRGLYHEDATEDLNLEYFTDLLYGFNYDALMLVCPLSGDTNEKKLRTLYTDVMKRYNKQIPIFILNNKVDLFIDSFYKEDNDDIFSIETVEEELSFEDIKEEINMKMESIKSELEEVQHKNRKKSEIISLPCYLKKDKRMSKEFLIEYNPQKAINAIINKMADHLIAFSDKIHFKLLDTDVSDININIDRDEIYNIVYELLNAKDTRLKVLNPAVKNISENIGKTPHGNSYNALKRRLRNGYGYTSNIDESYFINCSSFSIDFPAMLRNFLSPQVVSDLVGKTINFGGGKFKDKDGETKMKEFAIRYGYVNILMFVAEMVYFKAILEAEKKEFSYNAIFNSFLDNSLKYFEGYELDVKSYVDSIEKTLEEGIKRAIDLHIYYV